MDNQVRLETEVGFVQDLPVAHEALRIRLQAVPVAQVSDVPVAQIDQVVMAGGSTRIPMVLAAVEARK